jgi:hypothetical protein
LLSDGETTQGRSNDEAARAAMAQGVAVNTIAFGTDAGVVTGPDGVQIPVPVNRDALRALADETGGRYFPAYTEAELKQVYEKLGQSVETETVHREVTDWFTFAAMALALLAGVGSLIWFSRLPCPRTVCSPDHRIWGLSEQTVGVQSPEWAWKYERSSTTSSRPGSRRATTASCVRRSKARPTSCGPASPISTGAGPDSTAPRW